MIGFSNKVERCFWVYGVSWRIMMHHDVSWCTVSRSGVSVILVGIWISWIFRKLWQMLNVGYNCMPCSPKFVRSCNRSWQRSCSSSGLLVPSCQVTLWYLSCKQWQLKFFKGHVLQAKCISICQWFGCPFLSKNRQTYLETDVGSNYLTAPLGGRTRRSKLFCFEFV